MLELFDPTEDYVFKNIFGKEDSKDILMEFLNDMLYITTDPIVSIELLDTNFDREYEYAKSSRLDVKAITNKDEIINIEIQRKDQNNMMSRSLYYWAKMYSDQLKKNQDYRELKKTICINILNFKFVDNDEFHNPYILVNAKTKEEFKTIKKDDDISKIEVHFLELPKTPETLDENLIAWGKFLTNPNDQSLYEEKNLPVKLNKAKQKLSVMSQNEDERKIYDQIQKQRLDQENIVKTAAANALKQGMEQGEKNKQLEIAKNLLDVLDIDIIAQKTGLAIQEIEALKK